MNKALEPRDRRPGLRSTKGAVGASELFLLNCYIGGSGGMATAAPVERYRSVPDNFSGDGDYDAWERHFNVCAAANNWDDAKKLLFLPTLLRGRAFLVYQHLDLQDRASFARLSAAMSKGCRSPAQREVAAAKFRARKHRSGEPYDMFAYDLMDLFSKAYPGMPHDDHDALVRDQFIAGLDDDLRCRVLIAAPTSLAAAVTAATRISCLGRASGETSFTTTVREDTTFATKADIASLTSSMAALADKIENLQRGQTTTHQVSRQQRCFRCGREGHFARSCNARIENNGEGNNYNRRPNQRRSEN